MEGKTAYAAFIHFLQAKQQVRVQSTQVDDEELMLFRVEFQDERNTVERVVADGSAGAVCWAAGATGCAESAGGRTAETESDDAA